MLRRRLFLLSLATIGVTLAISVTACGSRGEGIPVATSVYDFTLADIKSQPHDFAQYRGKVLLIVNTASACGFTPQYQGLEKVYRQFKDKGAVDDVSEDREADQGLRGSAHGDLQPDQ